MMSPDDLQSLNDQIAAMARSGLPLDQGLQSLATDMPGGELRRVTRQVATDLKSGMSLPDALGKQSRKVPSYYPALVAAGIRTGRLPQVLATIGSYAKQISAMRATVIDAILYPAIVLFIGGAIITLQVVFILPQFETIYKDFGLSLPWLTRVILDLSRYPLFLLGAMLLIVMIAVMAYFACRILPSAHLTAARLLYKVPLIGTMVRSARMASFAEILALLIEFKVPLPEAFRAAGESTPDPLMAANAEEVALNLEQGHPLSEALVGRGLVPSWMAWMTERGEEHSQLSEALKQIGAIYRRQTESRISILRNVLPSFVIVFTAGTVLLLFAVAVMAPMAKLLEGLSK